MHPGFGREDGNFLVDVALEFDKVLLAGCGAALLIPSLKRTCADSLVSGSNSFSFEGFEIIWVFYKHLVDDFHKRRDCKHCRIAVEEPTIRKRIVEDPESNAHSRNRGSEGFAKSVCPSKGLWITGAADDDLAVPARWNVEALCNRLESSIRESLAVPSEKFHTLPVRTPAVVLIADERW